MTTVMTQPQSQPSDLPHGVAGSRSLFDRQIMGRALVDAFKKLNPRVQFKNPVMFVVLVGTVITLLESIAHPGQVRLVDHDLALLDRDVRQLRRGDGGRSG